MEEAVAHLANARLANTWQVSYASVAVALALAQQLLEKTFTFSWEVLQSVDQLSG